MSEQPIHLSADAEAHINGMLGEGSYRDASDYIESLIREDLITRQRISDVLDRGKANIERLAAQGLESGPAVTMDAGYWDRERQRLRDAVGKKQ
jgi:Arc/MetJ-type ribon-helix-helix transcriptional regulator